MTWINPANAPRGVVGPANSLVGTTATSSVGSHGIQFLDGVTYAVRSGFWDAVGDENQGAVTFFTGLTGRIAGTNDPMRGAVSETNSLVGDMAADRVGQSFIQQVPGQATMRYLETEHWHNDTGALTWYTLGSRLTGRITPQNSLVGSNPGDKVGDSSLFSTPGGNLVFYGHHFNGGVAGNDGGVFRYINTARPLPVGFFTTANSFIGAAGSEIGSRGIHSLGGERYIILSPNAEVDDPNVVDDPLNPAADDLVNAGRIDVFDGSTTAGAGGIGFDFDPAGDFAVSTPALVAFLNSGGSLHLQASNDITIPVGSGFAATAGSLFLEAGRSIDIHANLFVGGSLTLIGNSPNRNASFRDSGDGNITVTATTGPAIVAAGLLRAEAQNIILQGGSTGDAVAALIGSESATIFARGSGLVRVQAGSGGSGFPPQSSPDVFRNFFNGPNQFGTPAAFILGGNLALAADDVEIIGGGGSSAFAAIASFGEFTIETLRLKMEAGTGSNADAVLLGLGGVADISYTSCEGCVDLLGDPLFDATAQTGIYIAGLFQDPSIGAILAMLSQESDDDSAFDDDDDEEDSEDEESEGLQCP